MELISMVGCEIRSLLAICNMKFRNLKGIVQWSASKVGLFFNCGRFWVQMTMARVFCCLGCYRRTAYDITLVDDHWPQDMFNVISGNTSQSWERLHAGGLLSHSFELEGKVKGLFLGSPAVITFRIPTKAALQEAYSTPILPLDVLADKPPVQKFEWKLLVKYGSLISVISIVVLFVYLLVTPSKSGAAKAGKKRR
ncbi:hypothetical protein D5086_002835 [Populus alba]|uniref:Uncharacterized protein n=1 Tax=Populus alba TaxID=43335 RepID=A0ACC4D3T8_POPAL